MALETVCNSLPSGRGSFRSLIIAYKFEIKRIILLSNSFLTQKMAKSVLNITNNLKSNRKRPLYNKRATGLTSDQFPTLHSALHQYLIWGTPAARSLKTNPTQALKIALLYLHHNLTGELLADIF